MPKQEIYCAKTGSKQANIFQKKGGDYVADDKRTTTETAESKSKRKQGQADIATYTAGLSHAEVIAQTSKGGKRSGEVRREKGFVRRALLAGLDDKTLAEIRAAMLAKAKKGDTAMIDLLFKTVGESGADAVKVGVDDSTANLLCNMTISDKLKQLEQFKQAENSDK